VLGKKKYFHYNNRGKVNMYWLIVVMGYFIGAIPTAYIAGRLLKGRDIRRMGDGNMGAGNAFSQLGARVGVGIFFIDAGKGVLAIVIAQVAGLPQLVVLITGVAAVIGHNWTAFLGFRGGRGEATTIGILLTMVTQPMLILAGPALATLAIKKNVTLASAVLFIPLSLVCWWLGVSGALITYSIALPCLVGFTHFLRTRQPIVRRT